MRTTQADIHAAFARAFPPETRASNIGGDGDTYDNRHNIGKYALDYAPVYGGWVVIAFADGTSGMGSAQSRPFGDYRRAGREMLAWLEGLSDANAVRSGLYDTSDLAPS